MNELLRKYWPGVVEYVARYAEHYDAAEDIAQELFLRLWQKNLTWKQEGSLRSFLYGVAHNLARNQGRRWRSWTMCCRSSVARSGRAVRSARIV